MAEEKYKLNGALQKNLGSVFEKPSECSLQSGNEDTVDLAVPKLPEVLNHDSPRKDSSEELLFYNLFLII